MRLKKAFAVILAIAMVFGVVSMASAAVTVGGFDDAVESKHANQLAYLRATGIAKGDEKGNFNPESLLTRQEFATFVARLAKQGAAADFLRSTPTRYSDDAAVADWARGEVNLADSNGWVKGRDDGNFHPSDNLTYAEAVTVLVRLLGHEPKVTGAWPDGHIIKSINLGVTAGTELTDKNKNTPITRGDMGRMLYNSMFLSTMVHVLHDQYNENGPALYAGNSFTGKATAVTGTTITVDATTRTFADDVTVIGFPSTAMNSLLGQDVRIHTNASGKVTVVMLLGDVKLGSQLAFEKFTTESTADSGWKTVNYIVFGDGSKVKYNPNTTTYSVNGTVSLDPDNTVAPKINALPLLAKGDWMVVTESDGSATHVDITHFEDKSELLTAEGKARTKSTEEDRIAYGGATKSVGGAIVNLNGEAAGVTDLKTDDVVDVAYRYEWDAGAIKKVAKSNNLDVLYRVEATRKTVEGSYVGQRVAAGSDGQTRYVTIKLADGTNKEFQYGPDPIPGYVSGSSVKFILNARDVVVKDLSGQSALKTNAYKVLSGETDSTNYRIQIDNRGEKVWLTVQSAAIYASIADLGGAADSGAGWGQVQYLTLTNGRVSANAAAVTWKDAPGGTTVNLSDAEWDSDDAGYDANRDSLFKVYSTGEIPVLINAADAAASRTFTGANPAVHVLSDGGTADAGAGDTVSLKQGDRVVVGESGGAIVALLVIPAN